MAATDNLRVDPTMMRGFAQALCGGAEDLRSRLAELDAQVSEMLGGWRGASGSAYTSAWELWHRGAGEVEVGLSMLARLVAQAGGGYQENEAVSARALREVRNG
ncbi:MAG TPA: WXG100 family type VII secretion target [Mycobacterium sp.]|nr:WXG100 family type VII secretion target [Mycobacterium sp.]